MQEQEITAAGTTRKLEQPFFVLATQNPIEQEGTYPLPEAQLDRFMFSLILDYPTLEEEIAIVESTTGQKTEKLKLYRQNRTAHKQTCHWLTLPE